MILQGAGETYHIAMGMNGPVKKHLLVASGTN